VTLILVGNAHARLTPITFSGRPPFDPMAMHLPRESTLALNAVTGDGEAWNCSPSGCGAQKLDGHPLGAIIGVTLGNNLSPGYDGVVAVGPATASPPVLIE
jgi:hypothetical protein